MQPRARGRGVVSLCSILAMARVAAADPLPATPAPGGAPSPAVTAPPSTTDAAPAPGAETVAPPTAPPAQGTPPPRTGNEALSAAPPGQGANGVYGDAVPVWLDSEDDTRPLVQIYPDWASPGSVPPLAQCQLPCGFHMQRGRYRIQVEETESTLGGSRAVTIAGPAHLGITPRDRSKRTLGLVFGIGGIAAVIAGAALFIDGSRTYRNCDIDGICNDNYRFGGESSAGVVMLLAGAALTPIGWVMFGKSLRPAIDVGPAAVSAQARRPKFAIVRLPGNGTGLGASVAF
jgi:hypothetical protein